MRLLMLAAMLVVTGLAVGCETKPKPAVEEKKIEINAPGVKVDIERGKGVEVEAPGVDVEAKPKK